MGVFTFIILFGLWAVLAIVAFSMLTREEAPVSYFVVALLCPPIALYLLYELKREAKQEAIIDMACAEADNELKVHMDPEIDSKSAPWQVKLRLKFAKEYASMPECLKEEPFELKDLFNFKLMDFNEEWALEAVRKRVGFDTEVRAISSGLVVAPAAQAEDASADADGQDAPPPLPPSGVNVSAWRMIGRTHGLLKLILKDYGLTVDGTGSEASELLRQTRRLVKPTDAMQCACLASLNDSMVTLVDPADKETFEAKLEFQTGSDEADLLFKRFPSMYGEAAALDFDYYVNNDKHGVSDKEEGLTWKSVVALIFSLIIYLLIEAFFPD